MIFEAVAGAGFNTDGAAPGADRMLARADLLFCLARAFLPPPAGWSIEQWAAPLAQDLSELGRALGVDTTPARRALRDERERFRDAASRGEGDAWLVEYSRLFLVPPVVVPLNAGVYLEGGLAGMAAQMMRSCYRVAGIEPDAAFGNLPDHVAMQLEFIARLHERAARGQADAGAMADEFCREFVDAWLGPIEQSCRAAQAQLPAARVYGALIELLRAAVAPGSVTAAADR